MWAIVQAIFAFAAFCGMYALGMRIERRALRRTHAYKNVYARGYSLGFANGHVDGYDMGFAEGYKQCNFDLEKP